jgi:CheY-like chemotaxis protein
MNKNYDFNGKNILVVDDDLPSVAYATAVLKNTGANVISVNDGKQAVDKASKGNIDLILMDLRLPDMNGIDAMREIRKINGNIAIIAYTAHNSAEMKYDCFNSGCKEYLIKPVLPNNFLKTIDTYLNKKTV